MSDSPPVCCVCGGSAPHDWLVTSGLITTDRAWCEDCKQKVAEEVMTRFVDKFVEELRKRG